MVQLAIKGNYVVDVMSIEYNVEHRQWWVRTTENLKVPNRFPWVVVMAVGRGISLDEAMEDAAKKHVEAIAVRKKQEGLA